MKKLSGEIKELNEKEKSLQDDVKTAQKKIRTLKNVEQNINMLLGYSALETKGFAPTIPKSGLRFSAQYNSSYEEAEKTSNTEKYFQSAFLDAECAAEINNAINNADGNFQKAAEDILVKFGRERAESVVAAFVNRASAEAYPDFKNWASQKENILKGEPCARNKDIFRFQNMNFVYNDTTFEKFLRKFREVANSMKYVDFSRDDTRVMYWALPRELTESQKSSQMLFDALNNKDTALLQKLKTASQKKIQTQEINPPPQKRKNNDHVR